MKRVLAGAAFSLCLVLACDQSFAQFGQRPAFLDRVLSVEELQDDFLIFESELRAAHAGLDRYLDEDEIDELFETAYEELDRPMTAVELFPVLARIVAAIRCAHTRVDLPGKGIVYLRNEAPMLPLAVRFDAERAYVLRNGPGGTIPQGAEILAINGRSIPDITGRILPCLSADAYVPVGKWRDLGIQLPYWYFLLVEQAATYQVEVRSPAGAVTVHSLAGLTMRQMRAFENEQHPQLAERRRRSPFELRLLAEDQAAYLRVGTFGDAALTAFLAESFATIAAADVRHLILDVRENGGGEDELGALLTRYLIAEPHDFYRRLTFRAERRADIPHAQVDFDDYTGPLDPETLTLAAFLEWITKVHPQLQPQQPMEPGFHGPLYVLMDAGSFSSGTEVPAILHANGRGILIGEETGGAYVGCSAGIMPWLLLPASQLRVRLPLLRYEYATTEGAFVGRGALPHHAVRPTVQDLIAGHDPAMERALALIRAQSQ